jgi:hypothetical protein
VRKIECRLRFHVRLRRRRAAGLPAVQIGAHLLGLIGLNRA